jgi:hypothetical protein
MDKMRQSQGEEKGEEKGKKNEKTVQFESQF